ncbi:Filament-forming protein, partial [Linderina pennispora]
EQYEREIVAHAKDVETTLVAREKLRETQSKLTMANSELRAAKKSHDQATAAAKHEVEQAKESAQRAESRLTEIQRQNSILMAHLESIGQTVPDVTVDPERISAEADSQQPGDMTAPSTGAPAAQAGGEQGGLREIVVYLRRERDLVAAQLELAQQESQRWKQQANHTQRALDNVRGELLQYTPADQVPSSDDSVEKPVSANAIPDGEGPITLTASQRKTARQQIENGMLLRESNVVMRSDLNLARRKLKAIEAELSNLKNQVVPQLRGDNATLQAELEATRAQAEQLQGMCDHWKQRHEKVLARYQMIEPDEYESLKRENQQMKQQAEESAKERADLQIQANKVLQLQLEIDQLKGQAEKHIATLEEERKSVADKEKQITELQSNVTQAQSSSKTANALAEATQKKYDKLHNSFKKLREQSQDGFRSRQEIISQKEADIAELTEKVQALEAQAKSVGETEGQAQPDA